MSEGTTPPPVQSGYAAYPRTGFFGSAEKLERLWLGYKGTTNVFLISILIVIPWMVTLYGFSTKGQLFVGILGIILGIGILVGEFYVSIRCCRNVGFALGWTDGTSLLLGIALPFIGITGIAIVQYLALGELKKYGIRMRSFVGIRKKDVLSKVEELARLESSSSTLTM